MYYYGGLDLTYLLLVMPALALSLWAQFKVNSSFARYSKVRNLRGLTGEAAARAVLRFHGVHDVGISATRGNLTDHYDPRKNMIFLSESVYNSASIAAVGVAAHEAGHAVQYAEGYAPVKLRSLILPVCSFGSRFAFVALTLGLILYSQQLLLAGILLFTLATVFQLLTLPVEFNASRRALATIEAGGLLNDEEYAGARKVLSAAALTYVAALLTSIAQLLRFLLIFMSRGGGRRDRR